DADSRVVAYGLNLLSPGQDTLVRSILLGGVRPSHRGRGVGRQVLAWQEGRALQQFAASDKSLPGWMIVWADERATETIRLTGRFGFRIVRYFLELRRDLALAIEPRALDGFEVVPFTAERTEAVRLARNDAFQDHWGSQPTIEEDWREALSRSVFRRDLSFLAIAPNGDVAGFVLSEVNEEDFELQGFTSAYIELVGVTRQYRSRGVAAALLSRTLGAIADAGLEMAVLDVDSDSPTGALGLYTGLGFVAANRSVSLVREF
ncbi:MAG: GNAT family N-acetyltransferase, partial [Cryobacterium sp.]|nr:GNAT family N-acetyltransferase [Cryobacterium sp.]